MKMFKRIFAFAMMLCLLWVCVMPTTAMAAKDYTNKIQRFRLHKSGTYESMHLYARMRSTSQDGKTGWIMFEKDTPVGSKTIPARTTYKYKISSLKEGGKITLTYDPTLSINNGMSINAKVPTSLHKLTAKIHIDSADGGAVANIWKIDSMKTGLLSKTGFYIKCK